MWLHLVSSILNLILITKNYSFGSSIHKSMGTAILCRLWLAGAQQDQAACWREEEGRKPEIMSYQQTGTTGESVPQNDQGDGDKNVRHREWQERWGFCSECWLAESFPLLQQLHLQKTTIAQKDAREFTEKLGKFVTFSSRIFEREELIACPKLPPGLTTCSSWHYWTAYV